MNNKNDIAYICVCRKNDPSITYVYLYEKGISLSLTRDFTSLLDNYFLKSNWNMFILLSLDSLEGITQRITTLMELKCLVL